MTDITSALKKIQIEEVKFGQPISEYTTTKIGASINYLIENALEPIGTTIDSFLTEAQFQSLKGNKWVLVNGQDISGSDLAILTGITTLPAKFTGAASVQTDDDANLGDIYTGDVKTHMHAVLTRYSSTSVGGEDVIATEPYNSSGGGGSPIYDNGNGTHNYIQNTGGTNNLAAGYKMNKFVKINNDNT